MGSVFAHIKTGKSSLMKLFVLLASTIFFAITSLAQADQTIEEKVVVCAGCHGEDGKPKMPEVPNIWGQHSGYIYLQLKDFKAKRRASELMAPITEEMTREDMLAYAEYFSAKAWSNTGYTSDPAEAAKGQSIGTSGMCTSCHLGTYFGDSAIPHLAGQTQAYLEKQLFAFKTRARNNNPDMSNLVQTFSDDDLKLMSRFLAGQ